MGQRQHPHEVFAYTISGTWGYVERPWTAQAGDFVYEAPGEGHTLVAYASDEPMKAFFIVKGPLIWLDEDGGTVGYFDAHDYIELCRNHYGKVGIGAPSTACRRRTRRRCGRRPASTAPHLRPHVGRSSKTLRYHACEQAFRSRRGKRTAWLAWRQRTDGKS